LRARLEEGDGGHNLRPPSACEDVIADVDPMKDISDIGIGTQRDEWLLVATIS
jgi:hypothetical protein